MATAITRDFLSRRRNCAKQIWPTPRILSPQTNRSQFPRKNRCIHLHSVSELHIIPSRRCTQDMFEATIFCTVFFPHQCCWLQLACTLHSQRRIRNDLCNQTERWGARSPLAAVCQGLRWRHCREEKVAYK